AGGRGVAMNARGALVVGIDIGTSGVRAVAMTDGNDIVATGAAKLAVFSADHRDPAVWRRAMQVALAEMRAALGDRPIAAVAIDGTSGTMLPVDAGGRPLATPMMYNDPVEDAAILSTVSAHAARESA